MKKKNGQNSLNQEQRKAVRYINGPLLIVAGAGTGKTRVIVEKIKHLILDKKVSPDKILGLTFTEKAAQEMEERVDEALPFGYFQMWISTFHSFADQILKQEGSHIGLSPNYHLLTQAETVIFLKDKLFLFDLHYFRPLGNPNKFLEGLLQHFSRLRDEDISPEQYLNWINNPKKKKIYTAEELIKYKELAHAFQKYQDIKIKENVMDFSDLVYYLLRLLRTRKHILSLYRNQFKYILVDEFQDTNIVQYDLIKLLCPFNSTPNLTVVGDDSQAIYKFRGASVSNILAFMKDYKKAKQITLTKNYRSHQEILDSAYRLIRHNDPDTLESKLGVSKKLVAMKKSKRKKILIFDLSETVENEADTVSKYILLLKRKYDYSDIALLVRANNHAHPFIRSFLQHQIPYQYLGPGMLFKQPEVKDLIAYLAFLVDLNDSPSLYRILSMDIFGCDMIDIHKLLSFAKKSSLSLFQAIEVSLNQNEYKLYAAHLPLLKNETKKIFTFLYTMIQRHLTRIKKETAGQILYYFLEDTRYLAKLASYKTEKEERIALNISKFFNKLKSYEASHENSSIFAVYDYILMSMELGESPSAESNDKTVMDAVTILTVHSAKGLEFPVVFLVNLTKGRFPTYEKKEQIPIPDELIKEILPQGNYHEQEERRLFYVALTRAKDVVYLSSSKTYSEAKKERKISPFILEAIDTKGEKMKNVSLPSETKLSSITSYHTRSEHTPHQSHIYQSSFSFTQLKTYETCPLQYKYQYILKIPTTPSSSSSFGETIHKTLQRFYQKFQNFPSLSIQHLLDFYEDAWIPIGYSSSSHETRMKQEGKHMLTSYYQRFHNNNIRILDLEKKFKIKVEPQWSIIGKIDRIDKLGDQDVEIIDYKTGKIPEERELKKSLQLSLYALAIHDSGLYAKPLKNIHLTFYYLQSLNKVTMQKTEEDLNLITKHVDTVAHKINSEDYTPNVGRWCDFCPFRMICEAWQ